MINITDVTGTTGGTGPIIVVDPVPAVPSINGTEGDDILSVYHNQAPVYAPGTYYTARHMFGYGGNDKMVGGHGNDTIDGGAGDDRLTGGYGNDIIDGGIGVDTVDYGARLATGYGHYPYAYGNNIWHPGYGVAVNLGFGTGKSLEPGTADTDTLFNIENVTGTSWTDVLQGDERNNRLEGADGDDWLFGWGSHDTLLGGSGADHLTGGDGDDAMNGNDGDDSLLGGNGYDVLVGGLGDDSLDGGAGMDRADYGYSASGVTVSLAAGTASAAGDYDTLSSIEIVTGSAFNDLFIGGAQSDNLRGADGNDIIEGGGGGDYMYGENGDDLFVSGAGADVMFGGAGIDLAFYRDSSAAVDVYLQTFYSHGGDAEWDVLWDVENAWGSLFNDGLHGSTADNELTGLAGNDRLFGLEGRDTLDGGSGADLLDGGLGEDTANYENSHAGINITLATGVGSGGDAQGDTLIGIETIRGSNFADVLRAGLGPVWFYGLDGNDALVGNTGGDRLYGGLGNDQLAGNSGSDLLSGEEGRDNLGGGLGNDFLYGGAGADTMAGGSGGDSFVYHLASESNLANGRDVIRDFLQGEDIVDLGEVDAIQNYALHNEAFTFIGTAAFTGNGVGQLRYENAGGNTIIQGQTHFQAGVELEIVLTGNFALTANDFIL